MIESSDRLRELVSRFKVPIALSALGLVLMIGGLLSSGFSKNTPKEYPKQSLVQAEKFISVDVSGAVNNPGVYKLADSSRIEDAIKAAGGANNTVDQTYLSKYINLAQKITDGSKVYLPKTGEQLDSAGQVAGINTSSAEKVNINTASQEALDALSGIGPVTSSKIVSGRPYSQTDELVSKKILTKTVFDKIKDQLSVY